ncbi:MAG: NuoM family protein [Planctomycetaceae bacterium]
MAIWLFTCLGIPLAAAVWLMLFRGSIQERTSRWVALVGTIATLLVSLHLANMYQRGYATMPADVAGVSGPIQPRFQVSLPWLAVSAQAAQGRPVELELLFGLDGISVAMMVLTTVLCFAAVLISWDSIQLREAEFYAALLVLEAGMLGVFAAFDMILFYVFFELTLIPLFFLIAIWGGPQRRYAAVKFFLYTLAGSMITLVGLAALVITVAGQGLSHPTSLPELSAWMTKRPLEPEMQTLFFLAISTGFLVKVPVFPFHTWLPLAHVEAPTAGSVLLAGVLLKLGSYGFLRLCLPLFPAACLNVGVPLIGTLSVIGIVYGSLCALAQSDIKKLVAYSSVAHLGFCMLGLFALNEEGMTGGVLQMINHGLSTGGLFLLVGMVYDRYHTRMLGDLGGLASRLPLLACGMVFITMASIGLPGLNGFVGEVLALAGMFRRDWVLSAVAASGVVLGAWYMLGMLQRAFFGTLKEPEFARMHPVSDINWRELIAVMPIGALCLWIGVQPGQVVELIRPDIAAVAALYPPQGHLPAQSSLGAADVADQSPRLALNYSESHP